MQQASCLEGGPLLWIWPLYLHVNKKSDDDDDDDDGSLVSIGQHFVTMRVVHLPKRTETSLMTESY